MDAVIASTLDTALTAAPWLLLGLVAAGVVQALMPASMLQRWMGGRGIGGVTRAAIIGAPLPLCSCGAIPTAAVGTAIVTGLMVTMTDRHPASPASPATAACDCTSHEGCGDGGEAASGLIHRLRDGLRYAFTEAPRP